MDQNWEGYSHCAIGALNVASHTSTQAFVARQAMLKWLQAHDPNVPSLPQWNDHPDRTVDEVREAFLQAAKDLRNKKSE